MNNRSDDFIFEGKKFGVIFCQLPVINEPKYSQNKRGLCSQSIFTNTITGKVTSGMLIKANLGKLSP